MFFEVSSGLLECSAVFKAIPLIPINFVSFWVLIIPIHSKKSKERRMFDVLCFFPKRIFVLSRLLNRRIQGQVLSFHWAFGFGSKVYSSNGSKLDSIRSDSPVGTSAASRRMTFPAIEEEYPLRSK